MSTTTETTNLATVRTLCDRWPHLTLDEFRALLLSDPESALKQIGVTPLEGLPVPMNQSHQIRISREGYQDWTGPYEAGADLPNPIRLQARPKVGSPAVPLEPEKPKEPVKKPGFWRRLFGGGDKKETSRPE